MKKTDYFRFVKPLFRFPLLVISCLLLGWMGCAGETKPADDPVADPVFLPFTGEITELTAEEVPAQMAIESTLLRGVRYDDKLGHHYALVYQHGPAPDPRSEEEDALMASLQISVFNEGSETIEWAYGISETNCPFDLWVGLDTLTVTDLDKDGIAELGLVLSRTCRSDVSPAAMEVVLVENKEVYRLRGLHWMSYFGEFPTPDSYALQTVVDTTAYAIEHEMSPHWGRYTVSDAPDKWPGVLREHARKLWRQHVVERNIGSLSIE